MSRITNSNSLRLGLTNSWLSFQIPVISSHLESNLKEYVNFFLTGIFNNNENEVRFVVGKISLLPGYREFFLGITVYVARAVPNSENNSTSTNDSTVQDLTSTDREKIFYTLFPFLALLLEQELKKFFRKSFRVSFTLKSLREVDGDFVLNYFKIRLMQKVAVTNIIETLDEILNNVPGLLGYRIDVTGRFARQQRAAKLSVKKGSTLLSTISSPVYYIEDFIILKHGKCGFKIWMNQEEGYTKNSLICYTEDES